MAVFTPVDGRPERAWIEERLGEWSTMHSVVPRGYDAYVRVFHPIEAQLLDWTGSGYVTLEQRVLTWHAVARSTRTTVHPLMQWTAIGRGLPQYRAETRGWQYGEPAQGRMPVEWLSRAVSVLHRGGEPCGRAAVWEGYGWLRPSGTGTAQLSAHDEPADATASPIDESLPFEPAEQAGRMLDLPSRSYFVFDADLGMLADEAWARESGWGWGTSFWGDTPNLLWPLDRSWFLVSEIDFDSTVIGCSADLAAELLSDDVLETALIPEGASLSFDADHINR
ncbi:hypothetical protein ACFFGH_09780 [Lysobacter korlensis]|uniref:Uncharacterized protein n=1 Tax=Lysobacter korlensis TaxID=553636 RepID=A0ABV6RNI9_9GAMM